MDKMTHLVIHTTDTPFGRKVSADDIYMWHLGAKRIERRMAIFMGKSLPQAELKKYKLKLPSGKIVTANETDGRGWKQVGYSDMINVDGELINLVPYTFDDVIDSFEMTNGATGYNRNSRHVVLAGGWAKDGNKTGKKPNGQLYEIGELYSANQIHKLVEYVNMQKEIVPALKVIGHNEIAKKTCPNFDVQKFLKDFKL